MSATTIAILAASIMTLAAPATDAAECLVSLVSLDAIHAAPRFSDYPARPEPPRRPARVVIASKDAREFRTQLRQGAAAGPNFAGHFTVAAWGCGASCTDWVIVDARSGQVTFPPHLRDLSTDGVGPERAEPQPPITGLRFRRDSRLIAVLGAPEEDEACEGVGFYVWDGRRLNPVAFFARQKSCSPAR